MSDVTHRNHGLRFEKSQLVEFCLGRRRLTFACSQWPCAWCCMWFGADRKVSIERWYLSPYIEKPLNSKVIKSFVPELRSCKCFFCFGIPMLYMDIMNVLRTGMNMSISRIHIWLCYIMSNILDCGLVVSSNLCHDITFTFRLIPKENVLNPLSSHQLWVP